MTRVQPFKFAIIADTHIRPEKKDNQAAYPSDAHHTERARRAVAMINTRDTAFAVHLGDITHTLPGLENHRSAWNLARSLLGELNCPISVAPGNHDIGDKPGSDATAPTVGDSNLRDFNHTWGPGWRSWNHNGCHFVTMAASLLNSGSEFERQQHYWLEEDLLGHDRIFVFLHYPPYLLKPDEPSHYDNVAEPARSWLLQLLLEHRVEAVFAGHVHTFFVHKLGEMTIYGVPSTAFVRPEYSELFATLPTAENGRDDIAKLGALCVHVNSDGHRIELLRTALAGDVWERPAKPCPVGVWLRGGWNRIVDIPCGDLDEFRRNPRHGLIDRRGNPRAAALVLRDSPMWALPKGVLCLL